MTDIETSMRSITDPTRYEAHLAAFDLTGTEKADLINVLYTLAVEVIEADSDTVDKSTKTFLSNRFNHANLL